MARTASAAAAIPSTASTPGVPVTFVTLEDFAQRTGLTAGEVAQTAVRLGVPVYELGTSSRLPPMSQLAVLQEVVNGLRSSARRPIAAGNAQTQLGELRTDVSSMAAEIAAVRRALDALTVLFQQLLAAANAAQATGTPMKQEILDGAR